MASASATSAESRFGRRTRRPRRPRLEACRTRSPDALERRRDAGPPSHRLPCCSRSSCWWEREPAWRSYGTSDGCHRRCAPARGSRGSRLSGPRTRSLRKSPPRKRPRRCPRNPKGQRRRQPRPRRRSPRRRPSPRRPLRPHRGKLSSRRRRLPSRRSPCPNRLRPESRSFPTRRRRRRLVRRAPSLPRASLRPGRGSSAFEPIPDLRRPRPARAWSRSFPSPRGPGRAGSSCGNPWAEGC